MILDVNGNEPALGGDLKLPSWGESHRFVLQFVTDATDLLGVAHLIFPGNIVHVVLSGTHHYLYVETILKLEARGSENGMGFDISVYGKRYFGEELATLKNIALEIPPDVDRFAVILNRPQFVDTYYGTSQSWRISDGVFQK